MPVIKQAIRSAVERLPLPLASLFWRLASLRWDTDLLRRNRQRQRQLHLLLGGPTEVIAGPFSGMKYIANATGTTWLPRILGVYEKELWTVIEKICEAQHSKIVDVGAAEGYYAIGFARRCARATVFCFETEPIYRHWLRRMACLNGVQRRIEACSSCSPRKLSELSHNWERWFLFCDCEGGEDTLLDPSSVPSLNKATILVETHDHLRPGVVDRLKARFADTHFIECIISMTRRLEDWPIRKDLSPSEKLEAMCEQRNQRNADPQVWLFLSPKSDGSPADDQGCPPN
jgi:hypothetical protein